MAEIYARDVRAAERGSGWLAFAGSMLILGGGFKILDALWAFKYDDEVTEEVQTVVFENDIQAWGWVWLVVGIVLIITGFAVMMGAEWARWVGIVVGVVAALIFLPWIYFAPFWTMLSVGIAILVVYGLAAHGGRSAPDAPG
jgi:hypothetical protein